MTSDSQMNLTAAEVIAGYCPRLGNLWLGFQSRACDSYNSAFSACVRLPPNHLPGTLMRQRNSALFLDYVHEGFHRRRCEAAEARLRSRAATTEPRRDLADSWRHLWAAQGKTRRDSGLGQAPVFANV